MDHIHRIADKPRLGRSQPLQMAAELLAASPGRARSTALAMHERFAISGDFEHADLWQAVLGELPR